MFGISTVFMWVPADLFETDDDYSYFISRLFRHEEFLKEATKRSQRTGYIELARA